MQHYGHCMLKSRTVVPTDSPLTWVFAVDWSHTSSKKFLDFLAQLTPVLRDEWIGQFRSLLNRAAFGQLLGSEAEVKAIARHDALFELRWRLPAFGGIHHVRQYHAEPVSWPTNLFALHIHLKVLDGADDEVRAHQNREIDFAHSQFERGMQTGWLL